MENGKSNCVIPTCGKRISWTFWLCSDCEKIYGRRAKDSNRPEWVNYLIRQAAKERRAYLKTEGDISFDDIMDIHPFAETTEFLWMLEDKEVYAGIMPDSDWALEVEK